MAGRRSSCDRAGAVARDAPALKGRADRLLGRGGPLDGCPHRVPNPLRATRCSRDRSQGSGNETARVNAALTLRRGFSARSTTSSPHSALICGCRRTGRDCARRTGAGRHDHLGHRTQEPAANRRSAGDGLIAGDGECDHDRNDRPEHDEPGGEQREGAAGNVIVLERPFDDRALGDVGKEGPAEHLSEPVPRTDEWSRVSRWRRSRERSPLP